MGCVYAQWITQDTKSRTQVCQVYVANESSCWHVRVLTCMGTFTCVWWSDSCIFDYFSPPFCLIDLPLNLKLNMLDRLVAQEDPMISLSFKEVGLPSLLSQCQGFRLRSSCLMLVQQILYPLSHLLSPSLFVFINTFFSSLPTFSDLCTPQQELQHENQIPHLHIMLIRGEGVKVS